MNITVAIVPKPAPQSLPQGSDVLTRSAYSCAGYLGMHNSAAHKPTTLAKDLRWHGRLATRSGHRLGCCPAQGSRDPTL